MSGLTFEATLPQELQLTPSLHVVGYVCTEVTVLKITVYQSLKGSVAVFGKSEKQKGRFYRHNKISMAR